MTRHLLRRLTRRRRSQRSSSGPVQITPGFGVDPDLALLWRSVTGRRPDPDDLLGMSQHLQICSWCRTDREAVLHELAQWGEPKHTSGLRAAAICAPIIRDNPIWSDPQ